MTFASGVRAGAALAVALLLGVPAPFARADEVLYGGNDWYVTAAGIVGVDNSDVSGAEPSGGATISTGFRFNRWVATEIAAEWIEKIRYDRGSGAKTCRGSGGASNSYNAWQVTSGGRLYFTESLIQPYLLGHLGLIQTRDNGGGRSCEGTGLVARLGGGVDVFVSNGLAISILGAYVLPTTGASRDHDYVSLGLGITWY